MNTISPILQNILDQVILRAAECDLPGWCRTGLVAGAAAWDVCCECDSGSGQLWVRLIGYEPDPAFDQPTPSGCEQPALLVVGVGSLRCVPTLDQMGNPPSAEDEQASAELMHWDAQVTKDAVMCSLEERFWSGWTPLSNQGGCGGGEHEFRIPYHGCRCGDCGDSG